MMLQTGLYFYDGSNYRRFAGRLNSLHQYTQSPITPDELVVRVGQDVPVEPFGEIVFAVDGTHIFHGLITKIVDQGNYATLTCKSMQYLLDYRVIPYNIFHDVDLNTILSSDVPSTVMGVWFLINSYIPNGKWAYHSATVSKLLGGGIKSCFGPKALYASTSYPNAGSIDACDGVQSLSDAGAIPTAANQYYRDANDLYIRFGDGSYRENAYIVAALNWCDTRIRKGTIDIGTYKSPADFSLDGQASAKLEDFAQRLGREVEFLPWHDGTLRYNMAAEIPGRSSETLPIRTYRHGKNNVTITFPNATKPNIQAALGYSSDQFSAPQVVSDWMTQCVQIIQVYEDQGREREEVLQILQSLIDNNDISCKIITPEIDYYARPGDWFRVYHPDHGYFSLRMREKYIQNGLMALTLGKKQKAASTTFGEYLRGTVADDANPRINTNLTAAALLAGTASFPVSVLNGLKIVYEETYTIQSDVTVSSTAFVVLQINGKVIPPGRLRISSDSLSLKIDITDYCMMPGTNTVKRILQNATGYAAPAAAYVNQYIKVKFFAP